MLEDSVGICPDVNTHPFTTIACAYDSLASSAFFRLNDFHKVFDSGDNKGFTLGFGPATNHLSIDK